MGKLSTHILDLAHGRPARGVRIDLARIVDGRVEPLKSTMTNADGRTDEPLLAGDQFSSGTYRLAFHIGEYFRASGIATFLDVVPVDFIVADPSESYHVPLLASPWSYSVYRGS